MSDNFKAVLKQGNNDVTGDAIRTGKGGNGKYAQGWDAIFGKKGIPPEPGPLELPPLTDCMAEESTGYCHDNRCPKIAYYDNGGCPHRVKLFGGALGGGKSWLNEKITQFMDGPEGEALAERVFNSPRGIAAGFGDDS